MFALYFPRCWMLTVPQTSKRAAATLLLKMSHRKIWKFKNEIIKTWSPLNFKHCNQTLKGFPGSQRVVLRCNTWPKICTQMKALKGLLTAKRHHGHMLPSRHQPPCHICPMKHVWAQPHPEQKRPFGARELRSCNRHAPPYSCVGLCEHDLCSDELGEESPTNHIHGRCPEGEDLLC